MPILYEPRGAAREYSPLACNLYRGCGHHCAYCYAPACLFMTPTAFGAPSPRARVLEQLAKDAAARPPGPPVLLSFTSDPYQPIEAQHCLTQQAIAILGRHGHQLRVLTKNPRLALRDADLFATYRVAVGVSLVWSNDADRRQWEPDAAPVPDRLDCLASLHRLGISTWLSMEPIIDPAQALHLLRDPLLRAAARRPALLHQARPLASR
jgi:DNA repair photolyase